MPHFAGTSCPTWSKNSRATLLGLEIGHDRSDIARAVMEGVGYEVHWILESLRRGELKPNCIKSLGGATKSRVWMQIVSNITGLVISNPVYADTPVLGAAIIAGMRCALVDSVTQACAKLNQVSSVTEPDMATHREYIDLFDQYKQSFEFVRKGYTELLTEETQM